MCEFVSVIEVETEGETSLLYLTAKDLKSSRGRKLKKEIGTDINGHGAIRAFYNLPAGRGVNREYTDFSAPDNFPAEIARAIKAGEFRGFGRTEGLLNEAAWTQYADVDNHAWAEHEKVANPAHIEYEEARAPALAEFEKVRDDARAKYEKAYDDARAKCNKASAAAKAKSDKDCDDAWTEYNKIRNVAYAKYKKAYGPARAEYKESCYASRAKYEKATETLFWDLFADNDNRAEKWRDDNENK